MQYEIKVQAHNMLKLCGKLPNRLIDGTRDFITFHFDLDESWDGYSVSAQFSQEQNGTRVYYTRALVDDCVTLPHEIQSGQCTLIIYGNGGNNRRGVSNYLSFIVEKNIYSDTVSGTGEFSQSLYDTLTAQIASVNQTATAAKEKADQNASDISALQSSVQALQAASGSQSDQSAAINVLSTDVTNLKNMASGSATGTLNSKVTNLTAGLNDLQSDVSTLEGKVNTNTTNITNLANADFKMLFVNSLPTTGDFNTFYLVPKSSGNGYDKYWYVRDSGTGVARWDAFGGSSTMIVGTLPATGDPDIDYILKNSDGCQFYKYINGVWEVISGSMASVCNSLPANGNSLTDYYLYDPVTARYSHYRWINNAFKLIGVDTYSGDEIDVMLTEIRNDLGSLTYVGNSLPDTGEEGTDYYILNTGRNNYSHYRWLDTTDSFVLVGPDAYTKAEIGAYLNSLAVICEELPTTGNALTDYYLLDSVQGGYAHYRWVNNDYVLLSTLSYSKNEVDDLLDELVEIVDELPATGNERTDYYLHDTANDDYTHYRWIDGAFVELGKSYDVYEKSETYSKTQIDNIVSGINETNDNQDSAINGVSQALTRLQDDVDAIDTSTTYYSDIVYDEGVEKYFLISIADSDGSENELNRVQLPATGGGGGGGGTGGDTVLVVTKVTQSPIVVTSTGKVVIEVSVSATDSEGDPIDTTYTWKSGSTIISNGNAMQGTNIFDMTDYVTVGTQKLTLVITDEGGNSSTKSWTVQMVDVRIESNFSDRRTFDIGTNVNFTYTPYGGVNKTIHFKLDGTELATESVSSSGTLQQKTIPAQSHGAHSLEVWATATVGSVEVETDHIFKDLIWYNPESTTPVIGCIYRYSSYGVVTLRQYNTISIPFVIYDPTTNFPDVERYVDGELVGTEQLEGNQYTWNFRSDLIGNHTLKLKVRTAEVEIRVNIIDLGIDVSPVTAGLVIDFDPTGLSNSSTDRLWSNGTYSMSVSDNFDWSAGGYKIDENGDAYFLIKTGTRATFNYNMFGGGINGNPSAVGAEIKIIYETEYVQDTSAVWLTNAETTSTTVDGVTQTTNVGIQLSVHDGWLKTNTASETEQESGSESVAATNTYLYVPYSEEDIIELDINIEPINLEDTSPRAFAMAYEDGCPSKAFVYGASDRMYQYNPKPLVIGSDRCDVRIYRLKIYNTSLTTENIMRNFIADSRDADTMLARYDRNSIYYNQETGEYSPYSGEGVLDPVRLAPRVPNCKVLMLTTDHFTKNKKTFVKSSLRCIHASGGDMFPGDPYEDNWLFENGYHSGQGTTSDNYGKAGRNVDFLFNCDGVHKPSDKVTAEADYVSRVTKGYGTENAHTEVVTDWMGDEGKVSLTRTSIPNNYFNLKVNIASSENVNNALFQKRYNDFLPYISPAKARDSRVKNDMEFVPAILFIKETGASEHTEFSDNEWHFYALGNLGDSKKTDYTRAYDPEDMNEFTIEISDNTKNNATFQSGVYLDGNGVRQIETFTIGDDGEGTSVERPESYVYPVTKAEWEDSRNFRHWTLYNEKFDGDHSFEPRYACCGDYRDGKIVNDTHGIYADNITNDAHQLELNTRAWRAFVSWVVTSTDEQFVNEFEEWMVKPATLFFYAFTHRYTLMDNRAKNTFWHFAKTGTFRKVSRPIDDLIHVYCELIDGEYIPTTDTSVVVSKTYYTQYAFDFHDYDNDKHCVVVKPHLIYGENQEIDNAEENCLNNCLQRLSDEDSIKINRVCNSLNCNYNLKMKLQRVGRV